MIVDSLISKLRRAREGAIDSKNAFDRIDKSADPDNVSEWRTQEADAQQARDSHPEAMDIYALQHTQGGSLYFNLWLLQRSLT